MSEPAANVVPIADDKEIRRFAHSPMRASANRNRVALANVCDLRSRASARKRASYRRVQLR